jgi:hypothetical protein
VENEETIEALSARAEALLDRIQQRFSFARSIYGPFCSSGLGQVDSSIRAIALRIDSRRAPAASMQRPRAFLPDFRPFPLLFLFSLRLRAQMHVHGYRTNRRHFPFSKIITFSRCSHR